MSGKKEKKLEANNNLHECNAQKFPLFSKGESLKDSSLSNDDIITVWDFYVSHAPIRKDKNDRGNGAGLHCLSEYGWFGAAELTALERHLIKAADLGRFVMVRADTITETLRSMNLLDDICWEHPRAVLKQNFKVSVKENGSIICSPSEPRMICLFRHIRNAIAHNRIYYSNDGNSILLEDADKKAVTARILIHTHTLVDWIGIIDQNKKNNYQAKNIANEDKKTQEAS